MNKVVLKSLVSAVLAAGIVSTANAAVTGNINVVSSYLSRGVLQDGGSAAVQGGLDYAHDSGLYAGYWMSSLDNSIGDAPKASIENDFYAGYTGKVGDFGYTLGGTYYYYNFAGSTKADSGETKIGVSYGPVSLTTYTNLTGTSKGSTDWGFGYTQALPQDYTFTGTAYYKTYKDSATKPVKSGAFKSLILGVTHPLAAKGSTVGFNYIIGGRDGVSDTKLPNTVVGSLGLTF